MTFPTKYGVKEKESDRIVSLCQDIFISIQWVIFHGKIGYVRIYDALEFFPYEVFKDDLAAYGKRRIILNVTALKKRDMDALVNVVFHEMCHLYCKEQGIHDSDGRYHTKEFKKIAEQFGSKTVHERPEDGYMQTNLRDDLLKEIKEDVKELKKGVSNI